MKSADAIAEVAREFGQEDDITVLTLTRVATADRTAAELTPQALSPSPA